MWTFSTGVLGGHEAQPLMVDRTLYVVTPWPNVLYAFDLTQEDFPLRFKYRPDVSPSALGVASLLAVAACSGSDSAPADRSATAKVAPGSVRYDQYGAAGTIAPPAATMGNPLEGDAGAARQGEVLFAAMNCDGCHGGGGLGFVGPSLSDGRWRYGGDDGALFHSIFYGRPRGMPAYGGILSDTTIWQLVTYVQSLPVPSEVPTQAWR